MALVETRMMHVNVFGVPASSLLLRKTSLRRYHSRLGAFVLLAATGCAQGSAILDSDGTGNFPNGTNVDGLSNATSDGDIGDSGKQTTSEIPHDDSTTTNDTSTATVDSDVPGDCDDGLVDGLESDIDCGGPACAACDD